MRNLKKVLALTLAIALVLSMSVTAGAVNFKDKKDITAKYQDAVDLMSELSIMNGFPDGTYQPQGDLTRAQYLKMLYVVMNRGVDDQAVLYKDVQPFPFYDVRDYDWFNGYVKWGYGRQLIDGFGGGVFQPNGTVTGFQALKMSLTALGFSSEIEGYTGDAWKTQVLNDAQDAGLLLNLETENLSVNLTREAAAQLLHNTLFSQTVRYNTTYIPAKMEKGQTMAYTYYNLYTLRGVVVANEWASVTSASKSLAGESRVVAEASNIPKDMEGNNIGTGTYDLPYKAPLDMLGKEVVVYVRYANNYTTRPFDKVYGNMLETSRNIIKTVYAQADIDGVLNNTNSGINTDLDNYVVNDDYGLDSSYSKVSTATVVVNYNGNVSSTNKILAGSPITFIDYDNDGDYEYIIAVSLTYANVTAVSSDNKVTAIAGDSADGDFSGKRVLSAVAKSDIYGGADLKVDDRILYFPIGGKQGVMVVTPEKATLTASRSNATIAIISGKEYKQSKLDSRVVDLDDILVSENFNVEKEYYYYNSKVLEGSTGTSTSAVWALVIDSYTTGSGIVKNNQVKLVLQDGTTAVYKLNAIEDKDGNNMTITAASSVNTTIEAQDLTGSNYDANFSSKQSVKDKIFRATISEDKESVTLKNILPANPQVTGDSSTSTYKKGESVITLAGTDAFTAKNVLTSSVFFVKDNAGDYGAYVGRSLPTVASGDIVATAGIGVRELRTAKNDGTRITDATRSDAVAAVLLTGNIPVNAAANKTYGYVLKDPIVKYDSKYYISELVLFNGTEVVTLVGQPGVRSTLQTGTYSESAINTRDTDLSGPSSDAVKISKGDVIEYTLGADGKLYSIVTLRGASYTNILGTYNAYTAVAVNRAIDIVNPDALAAGKTGTVQVNGDTKYYGVNSDDVTGRALSNLPSDIGIQKGYYIKAIVKAGVATHVWVLEHKDTERVQDKIDAAGVVPPVVGSATMASLKGKTLTYQGAYPVALGTIGFVSYEDSTKLLHYADSTTTSIAIDLSNDADWQNFFKSLKADDVATLDQSGRISILDLQTSSASAPVLTKAITAPTLLTSGGNTSITFKGAANAVRYTSDIELVAAVPAFVCDSIEVTANTNATGASANNVIVNASGVAVGAVTTTGTITVEASTSVTAVAGAASLIVNGGTATTGAGFTGSVLVDGGIANVGTVTTMSSITVVEGTLTNGAQARTGVNIGSATNKVSLSAAAGNLVLNASSQITSFTASGTITLTQGTIVLGGTGAAKATGDKVIVSGATYAGKSNNSGGAQGTGVDFGTDATTTGSVAVAGTGALTFVNPSSGWVAQATTPVLLTATQDNGTTLATVSVTMSTATAWATVTIALS